MRKKMETDKVNKNVAVKKTKKKKKKPSKDKDIKTSGQILNKDNQQGVMKKHLQEYVEDDSPVELPYKDNIGYSGEGSQGDQEDDNEGWPSFTEWELNDHYHSDFNTSMDHILHCGLEKTSSDGKKKKKAKKRKAERSDPNQPSREEASSFPATGLSHKTTRKETEKNKESISNKKVMNITKKKSQSASEDDALKYENNDTIAGKSLSNHEDDKKTHPKKKKKKKRRMLISSGLFSPKQVKSDRKGTGEIKYPEDTTISQSDFLSYLNLSVDINTQNFFTQDGDDNTVLGGTTEEMQGSETTMVGKRSSISDNVSDHKLHYNSKHGKDRAKNGMIGMVNESKKNETEDTSTHFPSESDCSTVFDNSLHSTNSSGAKKSLAVVESESKKNGAQDITNYSVKSESDGSAVFDNSLHSVENSQTFDLFQNDFDDDMSSYGMSESLIPKKQPKKVDCKGRVGMDPLEINVDNVSSSKDAGPGNDKISFKVKVDNGGHKKTKKRNSEHKSITDSSDAKTSKSHKKKKHKSKTERVANNSSGAEDVTSSSVINRNASTSFDDSFHSVEKDDNMSSNSRSDIQLTSIKSLVKKEVQVEVHRDPLKANEDLLRFGSGNDEVRSKVKVGKERHGKAQKGKPDEKSGMSDLDGAKTLQLQKKKKKKKKKHRSKVEEAKDKSDDESGAKKVETGVKKRHKSKSKEGSGESSDPQTTHSIGSTKIRLEKKGKFSMKKGSLDKTDVSGPSSDVNVGENIAAQQEVIPENSTREGVNNNDLVDGSSAEDERQKNKGSKARRWSKKEDDKLRENMNNFCKENGVEDQRQLLFPSEIEERETFLDVKRFIRDSDFYGELGNGLNRPFESVYGRARRIFDTQHCKGKWTSEEVDELFRLHRIHGPDWVIIGQAMERSSRSVGDKFRTVKRGRAKGAWTAEEKEQLTAAVNELVGDSEETFNFPWTQIATRVPTRNAVQCRSQWLLHGKKKAKKIWTNQDAIKLITRLYASTAHTIEDVDWLKLQTEHYPSEISPQIIKKRYDNLKERHIADQQKSFRAIISELYNDVIPWLKRDIPRLPDGRWEAKPISVKKER